MVLSPSAPNAFVAQITAAGFMIFAFTRSCVVPLSNSFEAGYSYGRASVFTVKRYLGRHLADVSPHNRGSPGVETMPGKYGDREQRQDGDETNEEQFLFHLITKLSREKNAVAF